MRQVIEREMQLGEVSIKNMKFDLRSRDEIPKILQGLQSIYCDVATRDSVFKILMEMIPENVNPNNGRKGMDLWQIFVLGCLRTDCNWDYDKLHEMANQHKTIREMLGHGLFDADKLYARQTILDNVGLLTPSILDKINKVTVDYAHKVNGNNVDDILRGSCDSFVVETDVSFPTDISMLFKAIRKVIILIMQICEKENFSDWRQGKLNIRKVKKAFRKVQLLKKSTSKNPETKEKREQLIIDAHEIYMTIVEVFIDKALNTIQKLKANISPDDILLFCKIKKIEDFLVHADRQIEHIHRRVVEGETIAHHEKVFSIFEEHTEWISKGKAGVPVELGLKVCIVKDQDGFILNHHVMEHETDDQIAVSFMKDTQELFPNFQACSFDKGFHSKLNQKELAEILDEVVLPRKGKLSQENKAIEGTEGFMEARRKHSAVESSINALENHGLDRCLDHGLHGFKRYVALAVVARNIQMLGHILQMKEVERLKRLKRKQSKIG